MTAPDEFDPKVVEAVGALAERAYLDGMNMGGREFALSILRVLRAMNVLALPEEVVLPREPTGAMEEAGAYAVDLAMYPENGAATYPSAAGDGYRAMLAAAEKREG